MAHIAKYQSGAIGHMCALYEKSACSKIAESEQRERGIEKPIQIEAK